MSWKNILGKAAEVATGGLSGLAGDALDIVKGQFPDKEKQAEIELKLQQAAHNREVEQLRGWNEQEKNFQNFVSEHEGTTSDLKAIPILGPFMLFIRGCLRPAVIISTLVIDFKVLSGSWNLLAIAGDSMLAQQYTSVMWIMNIVVLVFLFGERGIKNVMPVIERFMLAKNGK